jgi:hypothetical protein
MISDIEANFYERLCGQHATATSSKDRWIGAYSIGLTFLGRLSCLNEKRKMHRALKAGVFLNEQKIIFL